MICGPTRVRLRALKQAEQSVKSVSPPRAEGSIGLLHARSARAAVARGSQLIELHAFATLYQDLHRLGSIHSIRRARSTT